MATNAATVLDLAIANAASMPAFSGLKVEYLDWRSDAYSHLELAGCEAACSQTLDVTAGSPDDIALAKKVNSTAFNLVNICIKGDNRTAKKRDKQVVSSVTRGDGMALLKALDHDYISKTDSACDALLSK